MVDSDASRDLFDGVLHVMPSPATLRAGGVWVTASNWADASRRRWGQAWFLTPDGVFGPDHARALASRPPPRPASRQGLLTVAPQPVRTFAKDVRSLVRARRFANFTRADQWRSVRIPFVWQHHDAFELAGFRVARELGVPLLLFVDAPQVWEARRWGVQRRGWGGLMERYGEIPQMRSADLVGCVSDEVAAAVAGWGVAEERILVLPCTADSERFHPDVSGAEVRQRFGLDDAVVVGWIGSFRGFHAVDLLFEAVAQGQRGLAGVRVVLVGDGAQRDSVTGKARELGLDVVFTGAVPHDDVPKYLAAMDIAVVTARDSETFHYSPLKLREYMSSGRAIVAPDVGDVARTLSHGHDALLYRPGEPEDLAHALARLAGNKAERREMGRRAHERYMQSGGADAQLETVMNALFP